MITASRRLARYCRHVHARTQLERGRRAWPSPDILPWQAWLQRRWEGRAYEHADLLLLHPYQEQVLWQQIIAASSWADALLQPANVAQRVMLAWALLRRYRVAIFPPDIVLNHDARAFKSWADDFADACRERSWCDTESMLDVLADAAERAPGPGGELVLLGFEHLTPQQQRLFAVLEAQGRRVTLKRPEGGSGTVPVVSAHADAGAEIRAAAEWARTRLEADAGRRIGVVIPDLHARRGEVLRQFEDCLAPGRLTGETTALPFSLAPGRPLSDYPVIAAALSLLSLCAGPLALAELGSLLRSPYLAGEEEERVQRARLDSRLRDYGEVRLGLHPLRRIAAEGGGEGERPRQFLDALAAMAGYLQQLPRRAAPLAWAGHISHLLTLAGWTGGRELDSGEYQAVTAWREALDRFVSLQLVEHSLELAAAVFHLRRIAAGFSFQPQTPETPIQIMGLAGAADMAFDHLWVAGLEEESWPPPAQPNPYIPLALQRRHAMPGAAADLCLSEARETLERLQASAGEVVLSYPQNEGERSLRPSPLLHPFMPGPGLTPGSPVPDYAAQILATAELQEFIDDRAPPLAGEHRSGGGTGLFRDQSACPFRAFARHRLHAAAPGEVDIGLSPRDRGLILHRVLHLLWQRLRSQERLKALGESDIEALLASVIADIVEGFRRRHPLTWTQRFTSLEKARLQGVLHDWLAEERRRAPFEVIACELEQDIIFEGLAVNTRIDRIDRLADGGEVIIDYKTGEASLNAWLGERPDDPQLPLYAVTREAQVAGVAFARLKRGRGFGYQGLVRDADILPGMEIAATRIAAQFVDAGQTPSWEALFTDWRATLARLAQGFCGGDARVDPKSPLSCRYCDQHAFCRIYETRAGVAAEADGDD